jgi:hypothetical protein
LTGGGFDPIWQAVRIIAKKALTPTAGKRSIMAQSRTIDPSRKRPTSAAASPYLIPIDNQGIDHY